jgi:hypothetical protein
MSILILFSVLVLLLFALSLFIISILLFGTASIEIDSREMRVRMTWTRWLQIQVSYISYHPRLQWRLLNFSGYGIPFELQKRPALRPVYSKRKRNNLRANHRAPNWQALLKRCTLEHMHIGLDLGNATLLNMLTPVIILVNCFPNVKVTSNQQGMNYLYAKMSCIPFQLLYTYLTKSRQVRY